ncbi:MAG: hypothetical protein ACKPJD_05500, partial [Planctomycetaceae bacterium]
MKLGSALEHGSLDYPLVEHADLCNTLRILSTDLFTNIEMGMQQARCTEGSEHAKQEAQTALSLQSQI